MKQNHGFTLVELLVVIAVLTILAGLLMPVLGKAREAGRRTNCINNLRQVNLAIRLYADDHDDALPTLPVPNPYPNGVGAYYKEVVKGYLGLQGDVSPREKVFICPSDKKISKNANHAFTSYTFSGWELSSYSNPRITGQKLSAIRNPARAVVVGEWPAFFGGSWHPFKEAAYRDAKNVLAFADGHAAITKIYWDGIPGSEPRSYEPPAGYNYSWSGN